MTGGPGPRRPSRRQAAATSVVVVTIAAIGAGLVFQATQRGVPARSPGATALAAGSPAAGSPAASRAPGWAAVDVGDLPTVATLEAVADDATGIAPDARFTLASRSGEAAGAIAQRLEVAPDADFTIAPSADGRQATLTPRTPLTAGRTYRVTLRSPDGALAGSWAFHVRGPVQVTGTIPGDAATGVPIRTAI